MVNTKGSTHSGTDTDFVKEGGGGDDVKSPTLLTYRKLDCQQKGRVWIIKIGSGFCQIHSTSGRSDEQNMYTHLVYICLSRLAVIRIKYTLLMARRLLNS